MEVVNDTKYSLDDLINRFNSFIKATKSGGINKYKDKNDNLKNGLDNYFRTGNSKREIGMRKVSGEDAKTAVENMVNYCENFLAGKKFLDEKIDNITKTLSDLGVKESSDYSMIFGYGYNPYTIITLEASDEDFDVDFDENGDGVPETEVGTETEVTTEEDEGEPEKEEVSESEEAIDDPEEIKKFEEELKKEL